MQVLNKTFTYFVQVVYNVDEETNLADKSALELFVPKDTDLYINNKKEKHVFGFVQFKNAL